MNSEFTTLNKIKSACSKDFEYFKERLFKIKNIFTIHDSLFTNLAFTLAETLIVMGIIGVVAALTLPNLNNSTNNKEKVAKVKKIYSNIEDAYGRAKATYGPLDEWFKGDSSNEDKSKRIGERITEFMKISKKCGASTSGCFTSDKPGYISSGTANTFCFTNGKTPYSYITSDGTSLAFCYFEDNKFLVSFDVDGPNKGSYIVGKDFFATQVGLDGAQIFLGHSISECTTGDQEEVCFAWVVTNDNMDYLKLKNGKCPNGTTTLDWTTNTTCN